MKAFWIVLRTVFGIIQTLVVIYVLAKIRDNNTRLIVAALGLTYVATTGMLLTQFTLMMQLDVAHAAPRIRPTATRDYGRRGDKGVSGATALGILG